MIVEIAVMFCMFSDALNNNRLLKCFTILQRNMVDVSEIADWNAWDVFYCPLWHDHSVLEKSLNLLN